MLLVCSIIYLTCKLHLVFYFFFFSSRRRHTRSLRDWSSDVCSSDLCGRRPGACPADRVDRRHGEERPPPLPGVPDGGTAGEGIAASKPVDRVQHAVRSGPLQSRAGSGREIGRASCRERVWVGGGGGV